MGWDTKSQKRFIQSLERTMKTIKKNSKEGLLRAGIQIRRASTKQCPVDTGNLRGSIYGPQVVRDTFGGGAMMEIGYTAEYADRVHEKTDAHFRAPGTKAKFLEDPVKDFQSVMTRELAKDIAKGIK